MLIQLFCKERSFCWPEESVTLQQRSGLRGARLPRCEEGRVPPWGQSPGAGQAQSALLFVSLLRDNVGCV